MNDPTSVVSVLGTAIPQASTFFITYIWVGLAGTAISFLRVVGLVLMWVFMWLAGSPRVSASSAASSRFSSLFCLRTPRHDAMTQQRSSARRAGRGGGGGVAHQSPLRAGRSLTLWRCSQAQRRVYEEQYTTYGVSVTGHTITVLLGVVFSCINPIVAPSALVYFALAALVEKYNNIFVYRRTYESSGQLWVRVSAAATSCTCLQSGLFGSAVVWGSCGNDCVALVCASAVQLLNQVMTALYIFQLVMIGLLVSPISTWLLRGRAPLGSGPVASTGGAHPPRWLPTPVRSVLMCRPSRSSPTRC